MATPAHPPLTPVAASSNIAAAGYDAANQQFAVQFKSGHIYTYSEVSPEVAERFQAADSKGRFFGEHVRQKFAGNKVTGDCPSCGDIGINGETCDDCGVSEYAQKPRG